MWPKTYSFKDRIESGNPNSTISQLHYNGKKYIDITHLEAAVLKGNAPLAAQLLGRKAVVTEKALQYAVTNNHVIMINLLLKESTPTESLFQLACQNTDKLEKFKSGSKWAEYIQYEKALTIENTLRKKRTAPSVKNARKR